LIELLDSDLENVGERLLQPGSLKSQIDYLAAKLRLYALPLLSKSRTEMENLDSHTQTLWIKGFHVALRIADIVDDSKQTGGSLMDRITIFYPKHYLRIVVMAGMYLLSFLAVDQNITVQDKVLARNSIKHIYETLRGWSRGERDEADRTAKMIEFLSQHAEDKTTAAYFKDPEPKTNPTIVENAVNVAMKIRRLNPPVPRNTEMPSLIQEPGVTSVNSAMSLDADMASIPPIDFSTDWEAWLSEADDIMGLLGAQSSHLWLPENWTSSSS
jgi:hypothetical protein